MPIVVRILHNINKDNLKNISNYYFTNTMGASFGAIFASFVLISFFGIDLAVDVAVLTNVLLAAGIFLIAKSDHRVNESREKNKGCTAQISNVSAMLLLLFINGFIAIGYQIIWYRITGVLLKDSPYAFSITLSIYLFGIGFGSYWLNKKNLFDWKEGRLAFYLGLNALIAVTATSAIFILYYSADSWPLGSLIKFGHQFAILPSFGNGWVSTIFLVAFWPSFLVLLPTFFMGAAFPLGISLIENFKGKPGVSASIGYTATIAGNMLGGLVTTFLLLPKWGSIYVLVVFAVFQLACVFILRSDHVHVAKRNLARVLAIVSVIALIALMPSSKEFYQKIHPLFPGFDTFYKEGKDGVAMAFEKNGELINYINGCRHGYRPGPFFNNLAFSALSHSASPKRVLIIGFGAGALTEAMLLDNRIESITLVELNRTAFDNLAEISLIRDALKDPRMHFEFDDARRFLERNHEQFDLITMDPIRSRSAFSNNIFSVEFFRLAKKHLSDEGVFLVNVDDQSSRVAKGLAQNFDYVLRYPSFLVATKNESSLSVEQYLRLVGNLHHDFAPSVQKLYSPPIAGRNDILRVAMERNPPTDLKPYLEYYLGDLLIK